MPYQPYQPSIPSHLLFENRKGRLRFALAQFDENKHGAEGFIRIGKGCRDDSCRRGEVEVLTDRTEARSGLFVVCSCREKGNANSNSMMNEEKLQIEVSLMQPRKDAYAHTGLQDDEFQFFEGIFRGFIPEMHN
jgi:hypothetical protein